MKTKAAAANVFSSYGGVAVTAMVLIVLLLVLNNNYHIGVVNRMVINAVVVIGLNLLVGYTGQISLGHAGFLGLGAYTSAILTTRYGWSAIGAMAVAAAFSALLALIVGRPILRLRGHFLAMATLGLGIIISIVITNESTYTSGPDGMSVAPMRLFGYEFLDERVWLCVFSVVLLATMIGAINLIRSPAGRALQSIHGSEVAAQVAGVDVGMYKTKVFVCSAVVASFMGSLTAHYLGFITPEVAGFFHSIELITMVVIGGMASIYGSVIGAVLLTLLPQLLVRFDGWETVIYGAILMVVMIFFPRGLVPTLAKVLKKKELENAAP